MTSVFTITFGRVARQKAMKPFAVCISVVKWIEPLQRVDKPKVWQGNQAERSETSCQKYIHIR